MGENLVYLANCTARDVFPDIGEKAGPPVILEKEGNSIKMTAVTALKGTVGGGNQIVVGQFGNIEMGFVIEASIIKCPILSPQPIEEEKPFFHLMDGLKDQWVAGEVLDFVC